MPIFLRTVIGNRNYELKLDWSKKSVSENTLVKAHGMFLSLLLTWDCNALLSVLLGGGRKWSMEYSSKV